MTDNLAAEIARHQSSECEGHESYCLRCEEPWPCLVRRLADENEGLRVPMTSGLRELYGMLERGRIECRCWGADACDPHAVLSDMARALEQPAPEREG